MNKKMILAACAVLFVINMIILTGGCGNSLEISLPDDPMEFATYQYVNPDNSEDSYMAFSYNDRTYISYGTPNGNISKQDIAECLGYIVQEGVAKEDQLVVRLAEDLNCNCLMIYYANGGMQDPVFYRAIDTKDKEINTPSFVKSFSYEYWKE